jgi:hypothetical protein
MRDHPAQVARRKVEAGKVARAEVADMSEPKPITVLAPSGEARWAKEAGEKGVAIGAPSPTSTMPLAPPTAGEAPWAARCTEALCEALGGSGRLPLALALAAAAEGAPGVLWGWAFLPSGLVEGAVL